MDAKPPKRKSRHTANKMHDDGPAAAPDDGPAPPQTPPPPWRYGNWDVAVAQTASDQEDETKAEVAAAQQSEEPSSSSRKNGTGLQGLTLDEEDLSKTTFMRVVRILRIVRIRNILEYLED